MAGAAENGDDPRAVTVVQVAAGEAHTLALTANGSVYAWGRFGRLGVGVSQDELIPTLMEIIADIDDDDSSQGSHSDTYSSRGDSRSGQLRVDRDASLKSKVTQVASGAYHSLALSGDGTVWSWGFNACQLGRDRAASFPAPITFPRTKSSSPDDSRKNGSLWSAGDFEGNGKRFKVVMIEAGGMISCAVDQEGSLWLWGAVPPPNAEIQAPDSSPSMFSISNIEKPERVHALLGHKVCRVACGNEHILALVEGRDTYECYAWGSNSSGQLGLGDNEPRAFPTIVTSLTVAQVGNIVDLACGAFHSTIITVRDDESTDLALEPAASPIQRKMQPSPQLMAQVMGSPKLRGRVTPEHYIEAMASPKLRSRQADRYQGYPYPGENNGFSRYSGYSAYSDSSSSPKLSSRGSSQVSMMSMGVAGGRMQGKKEISGLDGRVSICWTFGQGENGQLGHGTTSNVATPTPVDGLPARERLQTVVCGLFHTGVVSETGDVWVWGMEGGLGLCPGIGPPGSRNGDALVPVRVFGESSAKCHPQTGSKGIACGAAHTVTVANGGKDIWAWGRGQSGVLGLGHASDSWFPCPVVWPPGSLSSDVKDSQQPEMEAVYEATRKSSRGSSRTGSKGRGDEMRPYIREGVERMEDRSGELRPPRADPPARKQVDYTRLSRRGDDFRPAQQETEDPRPLRRELGMETTSMSLNLSTSYENGTRQLEDVSALKAELAECRRYAETLHAAVYGGLQGFSHQLPRDSMYSDARSSELGRSNGLPTSSTALQDWQRCIDAAPDQDLVKLELFYKGMRNRLKDLLFQRKMEDWCRRCMSALSSSSFQEPPPVREPFSAASTPSLEQPSEFALRMSGILADRGEMLPPAALAASLAEFRNLSQRRR